MSNKKVRVLSLDGGGIRGIIPATVVSYVESRLIQVTKNPNARIADYFDIIVGTSTGGILGCFYLVPNPSEGKLKPTSKFSAQKALEFYANKGYDIFNASKRNTWLGIRSLFNSTSYSADKLEQIFNQEFGDLKLSELLKPCVVTTYDLQTKSAFFFNSREDPEIQRDFKVKDVVRSTSAAPTYFPSAFIKNLLSKNLMYNIDGGVFANNPAMCAYAECRNTAFPQVKFPSAKDMLILSIGTGGGQFELPDIKKSKAWGLLNWAKSIPEIMMDGSIDTVDYQMKKIFETLNLEDQGNYKRIDVPMDIRDYAGNMADASDANIRKLKLAGEATVAAAQMEGQGHTLDSFVDLLIENQP